MSVADIRSQLLTAVAIDTTAISTNTDTVSAAVDTADYDEGSMFAIWITSYTDGDYLLVIQESDDGSTGWADLSADKYIGDQPDLSAASIFVMSSVGCFSTKRYLRAVVRSTNVTTGASALVTYTAKGEYQPVHADSVS